MSKAEVLQELFKSLGKVYNNLPDCDLKKDYGGFIHYMFNNPPLESVAEYIEKRIKLARESKSANSQTPSKTVVQFWERIRGMIVSAYREVQGEDD